MAKATVYNPKTGERKVVTVGDPNAFTGGFVLETKAPTAETPAPPPAYKRSDDGGIEKYVASPLDKMKSHTNFMNTVKEAIQKKMKIQQPLTEQKAYWRTLERGTQPFGGAIAKEVSPTGQFADKSFRGLSPAQQASVRASRSAAASAHLQGIREEEEYRGTRIENVLQTVGNLYKEKVDEEKAVQDKIKEARIAKNEDLRIQMEKERLQIAKDKAGYDNLKNKYELTGDASWTLDENNKVIRDLSYASVDDIANAIKITESGGDYSRGGASGETGAYQFMPDTWIDYLGDYQRGTGQPLTSQRQTPGLQDAVAKFKIQEWLDKGASPRQIAAAWNWGEGNLMKDYSGAIGTNAKTGVKYNVPAHVGRFAENLAKIMPAVPIEEKNKLTDTRISTLAARHNIDPSILRNMTQAEIDQMEFEYNQDKVQQALNKIPEKELIIRGITDDIAKSFLTDLANGTSQDEIKKILEDANDPTITVKMFEDFMSIFKKTINVYSFEESQEMLKKYSQ
jgi:hypothetical protein